ncbi:Hypothetical protein ING2D1G_1500 [Peptoniphilus sp. ING2-D1G]|nr:Hypothetical protein ING2D1G_1500 [Peptoniphilus sp. ING2-D1G]
MGFLQDKNITKGSDETFKGDELITRGELTAIAAKFTDIDLINKHWAYYELMEASYNHDYERKNNGIEDWYQIRVNPREYRIL